MEIQPRKITLNPSLKPTVELNPTLERKNVLNAGLERKDTKPNEDPKLRKACQEMESLFLGQLLRNMRSTVSTTDLFGSEKEEAMFRDMLDDEIAKSASKQKGIGIADMLYNQLSKLQNQLTETNKPLKVEGPTVEK